MQLCGLWEQGCKEGLNDRSVHSGQSAHCRLLFTCLWPSHHCHGLGRFNCKPHELVLSVEKVLCFRAQRCGGALSLCAFHGWVHKARIPPRLSACACVVMCWGGAVVLQQQTGLISDIKQSHISGRKQTELTAAPHLHLLQVHASQPSTSRKRPSHKDIKSRIKVIDGSLVISGY